MNSIEIFFLHLRLLINILALIGNSFNIFVYFRYSKLRTFYFKLVMYLSMIDLNIAIIRIITTPDMLENNYYCSFSV
jgi:hypothetical protein